MLASGQKVYPEDVENVLKVIPGVADATVVAMLVRARAGRTRRDHSHERHDGRARCGAPRERAPGTHQQIRGYSVWPDSDFPRTALQKVKKHAVVAALLERSPAPVLAAAGEAVAAPVGREGRNGSGSRRAWWAYLAALTPEATLGEGAGLDSLRQIELLAAVEREMGVHVDEFYVGPTTTMREVLALIEHEPGAPPPDGIARRPQNGLATMLTRRTAQPPRPLRVGPARWYPDGVSAVRAHAVRGGLPGARGRAAQPAGRAGGALHEPCGLGLFVHAAAVSAAEAALLRVGRGAGRST